MVQLCMRCFSKSKLLLPCQAPDARNGVVAPGAICEDAVDEHLRDGDGGEAVASAHAQPLVLAREEVAGVEPAAGRLRRLRVDPDDD